MHYDKASIYRKCVRVPVSVSVDRARGMRYATALANVPFYFKRGNAKRKSFEMTQSLLGRRHRVLCTSGCQDNDQRNPAILISFHSCALFLTRLLPAVCLLFLFYFFIFY